MSGENLYRDGMALLTARHLAQERHDDKRCWGISSDALTYFALGLAGEPSVSSYPVDKDDLRACERTYRMASKRLQKRMLPVLRKYRRHVKERERVLR